MGQIQAGTVAQQGAVTQTQPKTRLRVVCFGDSITQFGFSVLHSGWLAHLADWWQRKADVINRGFSGYNSRYARIMVESVVLTQKPDVVIIFFGANDAAFEGQLQHVPLEEYKSNVASIVAVLRAYQADLPIILIAPPPVWEPEWERICIQRGKKGIDRNNKGAQTYGEAVKDTAQRLSLPVVDAWTAMQGDSVTREEFLDDGLHLNARGNLALFTEVVQVVQANYPVLHADALPLHLPDWKDIDPLNPQPQLLP